VGRVDEVVAWVTGRLAGRSLAVDDLHLAHPATLAVLCRLAGTVPLVVTLATDDPRAAEPARVVGTWPRVRTVEVGPLAPEAAIRLVRRLAPGLDGDEAGRVAARAGGAPGRLVAAAALAAATAAERPAPPPVADPPAASLTAREAQVLRLVAAGAKTAQIAARLGIADSTVESHVRAIRTKLGVRTRTAAAAWAG
jgi:DNA-binding CsgD family transcriptional regulator